MLTVGSVCSGAGGFDLGFQNAGYRTTWLCEFDHWRQQLLAQNFPGVPCHPDLRTLDPADLERPDVLIGGTPCQDLSVAGQRAGLDGERSGLFWDYCRIRNALNVEWCVWENVGGALSSNQGLDFASVLGAFVGADVPVPADGWPGAGVVAGPWGGACWRVLDAQHFGVPQRRRRVFVVGRLGGPCPPEVLLEPAGSGRDLEAGGQARPRVAAALTRGSSRPGVSEPGRRQEDDTNLVAGTVRSHCRPGSNDWGGIVNALDTQQGGPDDNSAQAGHLIAADQCKGDNGRTGADTSSPEVPEPRGHGGTQGPDIAGALTRRVGKGVDSDGAGMPLISHTLRGQGFDASEDGTGRGTPLTTGLPLDAGPDQRGREPVDGQGQQCGSGKHRGGDGASPDADGVRAPDGLAGWLDRSAYDPQPDGRRYAGCGDGVVASVAEWIARRIQGCVN